MFQELADSKFLKFQVIVLFLTTYIDWVIMPYVTKLEGTYLPVFMISFYMLLSASDGLIQPLFKKIRIYHIYLFVIILDVIQIVSYFLAYVNMLIFTYAILSIFTFQAITFEISRIHTTDFMQEYIEIKDYLLLRSFIVSSAIVSGAVTAMILDFFDVKLTVMLNILAFLGIFAIIIEYKLYVKFKMIVQTEDIIIEKQKFLVNEKINV